MLMVRDGCQQPLPWDYFRVARHSRLTPVTAETMSSAFLACNHFVFDARAFVRASGVNASKSPNLKSFSRGPVKPCLSLVYSWWSRFCLNVVSQEISFFCSRSLATRSAFRSLASLQSA